jgi:hypothetical protein
VLLGSVGGFGRAGMAGDKEMIDEFRRLDQIKPNPPLATLARFGYNYAERLF